MPAPTNVKPAPDQNAEKKRMKSVKPKTQENYDRMEAIRERLDMTQSEFSLALGYVTSCGYEASVRHGGGATLMQLLAAEGVERRYAKAHPQKAGERTIVSGTLVFVFSDGTVETCPVEDKPQTANLMGQDYFLIPKK